MNISRNILVALLLTLGVLSVNTQVRADGNKPVIALIAFGTSVPEAQKSFQDIDDAFTAAFPGYDIRWAFTAQFIIDKLAKEGQTTILSRNVPIVNPEELFKELSKAGTSEVYVQSLHVVPGGEYTEVTDTNAYGMKIHFSKPLLSSDSDIEQAAKILSKEFAGSDAFTILAGHGNDHHEAFNKQLIKFNDYLLKNFKNVELATVEGPVGTEKAFEDVKKSGLKKVKFIPFMIVAGDHIMNDVTGDEEDSWKSLLGDVETSVIPPLGQNPEIIAMFISHLKDTL